MTEKHEPDCKKSGRKRDLKKAVYTITEISDEDEDIEMCDDSDFEVVVGHQL